MNKTLNISDIFTPQGIQKLKKGQLLRFNMEGSYTELLVTYVNKKAGKVYAKETKTFTPDEVADIEAAKGNTKDTNGLE